MTKTEPETEKLSIGDTIYSEFFKAWLTIVEINSDDDWYFTGKDGKKIKAETPLSFFNKLNIAIKALKKYAEGKKYLTVGTKDVIIGPLMDRKVAQAALDQIIGKEEPKEEPKEEEKEESKEKEKANG